MTSEINDAELVIQAKKDPLAFGPLYERYVDQVYNYIFYRVGNHHDAEDLTARTFFRALKHIGKYEERGVPMSAWFYRIAHNLVANWHRDQGRHPLAPLDVAQVSSSPDMPETVTLDNERHVWLLSAVRRLPDDRQQLIVLKFVERMSNAEIGAIMERTEGAIKSLYHRTLIALRQELGHTKEQGEKNDDD